MKNLSLKFILFGLVASSTLQSATASEYVLPTQADFPYVEEGKIYKSDFPLQIVFDTIPSQPVMGSCIKKIIL